MNNDILSNVKLLLVGSFEEDLDPLEKITIQEINFKNNNLS
mgnify:CR=1 FL=1